MATVARANADVGLIGLAVMGESLALNMVDRGYYVAVYKRTTAVMEKFVAGRRDTPGGLGRPRCAPDRDAWSRASSSAQGPMIRVSSVSTFPRY